MNKKQTMREQVSELSDGELSASQVNKLLNEGSHQELLADWNLYHSIGDVLRSDDTPIALSKDFAAKFAARFEQEPTILAPASAAVIAAKSEQGEKALARHKRWMFPSVAAVLAVIVASLSAPQFMTTSDPEQLAPIAAVSSQIDSDSSSAEVMMLRDARIDDYLLAHQQFSPSIYNSAQYVRSATFASDSSK